MTIIPDHKLLDCLFEANNPFILRRDRLADSSATGEPSDHRSWRRSIDHLISLRSLEDDWDGQRAIAPAAELLEGAIGLARWLQDRGATPPVFAIAGVNGTIHFEWIALPSHYLLIEVVGPGEAEVFSKLGEDQTGDSGTFHW